MDVSVFVKGLAADLNRRCERLITQLSEHEPHPDVTTLNQNALSRLQQTRSGIQALLHSSKLRYSQLWCYALSDYQDLSNAVALVEQYAMPVLLRYNDRDHQGYVVMRALAHEVGYPDKLMPTVITTSEQYYWAQPELGIVGVPTGDLEGGILGWPDLLHELAHLLLAAWPDFLAGFTPIASRYFRNQRNRMGDLGNSDSDNQSLAIAQIKWGEKREGTWRVELAADLIATYLIGPAYGWQHVRLAATRGGDPYYPSPCDVEEHPADQARLDALLIMLALLDMESEADKINARWLDLLTVGLYEHRPAGYDLYYPAALVQELAKTVFESCQQKGLTDFGVSRGRSNPGVVALIDQAWRAFSQDPTKFPEWERHAIGQLKHYLEARTQP